MTFLPPMRWPCIELATCTNFAFQTARSNFSSWGDADTVFHTFCPSSCSQRQFWLFYKCPASGESLLFRARFIFFPSKETVPVLQFQKTIYLAHTRFLRNRYRPLKANKNIRNEHRCKIQRRSGDQKRSTPCDRKWGAFKPRPRESLRKD